MFVPYQSNSLGIENMVLGAFSNYGAHMVKRFDLERDFPSRYLQVQPVKVQPMKTVKSKTSETNKVIVEKNLVSTNNGIPVKLLVPNRALENHRVDLADRFILSFPEDGLQDNDFESDLQTCLNDSSLDG